MFSFQDHQESHPPSGARIPLISFLLLAGSVRAGPSIGGRCQKQLSRNRWNGTIHYPALRTDLYPADENRGRCYEHGIVYLGFKTTVSDAYGFLLYLSVVKSLDPECLTIFPVDIMLTRIGYLFE